MIPIPLLAHGLSPGLKMLAAGLEIILVAVAVAFWTYTARGWGIEQAEAVAAKEVAIVAAEAAEAKAQAERARADMIEAAARAEIEADRRVEEATRELQARIETVKRAANEKNFSGCVRPGPIERVRDEQLAELEAAASRTALLSGRSVRPMPSASAAGGEVAR